MKPLTGPVEDALRAYMSEENQGLNESQALLDFAAMAAEAKHWEHYLVSNGQQQPQPIRILALLFAEMYYEHTGEIIHRGRNGGPHARMLLTLANAAGLADLRTGKPYSEKQAQEAIKTTRDDINARAGVKTIVGRWLRDDARVKVLKSHIVGYENVAGEAVADGLEQGAGSFPVFGGYEPGRARRPASEMFKDALAGLLTEGS